VNTAWSELGGCGPLRAAPSHGTGAYAGISGHGIYPAEHPDRRHRNSAGKCSNKLPPVAFQQIIKAQGPVSL
jgi:hypothetical protein